MPATSPARRRFLELLVSVAAVHVVAITLYYLIDIPHAPAARQRLYAWVWMAATVAVVFVGLQRLKRARRSKPGRQY
jgi:hypothetical protein